MMSLEKNTESNSHLKAVSQALFVTFLWSTSWVLIKIGIKENLPPVTFAGLRYTLAFFCLMPLILLNKKYRMELRKISSFNLVHLTILGVVFYAITQGAQFVSLAYLPAATLTLLLNLSPILVALISNSFGSESPTKYQWGGIFLSAIGVLVYFYPVSLPASQIIGLTVAIIGVAATSISSLLGRRINHQSGLSPIMVTTISMGVGGLLLLGSGIFMQGVGQVTLNHWFIIGWLAVVNTAFAFPLWNASLQKLTATESSVINSTMLPQIAILAWLFLNEPLTAKQIVGMLLVGIGTLIVQLARYLPISLNSFRKQSTE
jgi:drug/metabolite transporter (DMT)-like permease